MHIVAMPNSGLVKHDSIDKTWSFFKSIDGYFASGLVKHVSIDCSWSQYKSIDGYVASGLVEHDSIDYKIQKHLAPHDKDIPEILTSLFVNTNIVSTRFEQHSPSNTDQRTTTLQQKTPLHLCSHRISIRSAEFGSVRHGFGVNTSLLAMT